MGVKKSNKRILVTRCSMTSQNDAKNEQHKHQVRIYTAITLSLHLIPFFCIIKLSNQCFVLGRSEDVMKTFSVSISYFREFLPIFGVFLISL